MALVSFAELFKFFNLPGYDTLTSQSPQGIIPGKLISLEYDIPASLISPEYDILVSLISPEYDIPASQSP